MNANLFVELSDDSAENIGGEYYFGDPSYTNITEQLYINKQLNSNVNVSIIQHFWDMLSYS